MTKLPFATNWGTAHPPAVELAEQAVRTRPPGSGTCSSPAAAPSRSRRRGSSCASTTTSHGGRSGPRRSRVTAPITGLRSGRWRSPACDAQQGAVRRARDPGPPRVPDEPVPAARTRARRRRRRAALHRAARRDRGGDAEEGPDTIAVIIAEPVQNAGGCLTPPPGYWQGLRELADKLRDPARSPTRSSALRAARRVVRLAARAADARLITVAKGLTSAYTPMGAVFVADRVVAPLYDDPATLLLHGITFGGHPALRGDRAQEPGDLRARRRVSRTSRRWSRIWRAAARAAGAADRRRRPRRRVLLGGRAGRRGAQPRFDAERARAAAPRLPAAAADAGGLIARPDDRGDAVLQVAPPLISTEAEQLDEMVEADCAGCSSRPRK